MGGANAAHSSCPSPKSPSGARACQAGFDRASRSSQAFYGMFRDGGSDASVALESAAPGLPGAASRNDRRVN